MVLASVHNVTYRDFSDRSTWLLLALGNVNSYCTSFLWHGQPTVPYFHILAVIQDSSVMCSLVFKASGVCCIREPSTREAGRCFTLKSLSPCWFLSSHCAGQVLMWMVFTLEHLFLPFLGNGGGSVAGPGSSPGLRHPLRLLPKGLHALLRQCTSFSH